MNTSTNYSANFEENKNNSSTQDTLKLAFEALKNYKNSPNKNNSKYQEILNSLKGNKGK